LFVAETILREIGRPTLGELLELVILIAQRDPRRHARVSARWLLRYLEALTMPRWSPAANTDV
jgi:hypothetical protein